MPAKTLLTSLVALLGVTVAANAHGAPVTTPDTEVAAITVNLADIDLRSDAGFATAMRRIQTAANEACGGQPDTRLLDRQAIYSACMHAAVDRAVTSLDNLRVAAGKSDSIKVVSR
jgi:UrcA family protein